MENTQKYVSAVERTQIANRVSVTTLVINILLAIIKIIAGIVGKSSAMLADGIHTVSDVVTTVAVIIGIRFSSKPADEDHPYGHEKIESVLAKMLAIVLMFTAFTIGKAGVETIMEGNYQTPTMTALIAAIISIFSKEVMFQYTMKSAEKINSAALKADAWHHRSDALSSIGTLVGVGGAMLGYEILDPIAALVVSVIVIKVAVEIFIAGFNQLVDSSAPKTTIEEIVNLIKNIDGVKNIDDIKTRMHGTMIYVDAEISVLGTISVVEGHNIAEDVHLAVEKNFLNVKHCTVHVNPFEN